MQITRRRSISKGISPLIAAVLLVAFTMAIAGIMAAWATTFTTTRLAESGCALSLSVLSIQFSKGNVSLRIANEGSNLNLTDFRASLIYTDKSRNTENLLLRTYNPNIEPLGPSQSQTVIINTSDNATSPDSIDVVAGNCLKSRVTAKFSDFR